MREYWSNLKLIFRSNVIVFVHSQFVVITSMPWCRKIHSGIRLMKNARRTASAAYVRGQSLLSLLERRVLRIG